MKNFKKLLYEVYFLAENLDQIISQRDSIIQSNLKRDEIRHKPGEHLEHFKKEISGLPSHHQNWIVKHYAQTEKEKEASGGPSIGHFEDIRSRMVPALEKFDELVSKGIAKPETLSKWKSASELEKFVRKHDPESKEIPGMDPSEYERHAENEHWVIHVPHTENAACGLGHGTNWCTASRSNSMFDEYDAKSPLYVITPKNPKYKGEKYQLHIQSNRPEDQFKNEEDKDRDINAIHAERPLPGAVGVYLNLMNTHKEHEKNISRLYSRSRIEEVSNEELDERKNFNHMLRSFSERKKTPAEQVGLAHYLTKTVRNYNPFNSITINLSRAFPERFQGAFLPRHRDALREDIETRKTKNRLPYEMALKLATDSDTHPEAKAALLPALKKFHDEFFKAHYSSENVHSRLQNFLGEFAPVHGRITQPQSAEAHEEDYKKAVAEYKQFQKHTRDQVPLLKNLITNIVKAPDASHRAIATAITSPGFQNRPDEEYSSHPIIPPIFKHNEITEHALKSKRIHPGIQNAIIANVVRMWNPHQDKDDISANSDEFQESMDSFKKLSEHPSLHPAAALKATHAERESLIRPFHSYPGGSDILTPFTERLLKKETLSPKEQRAIAGGQKGHHSVHAFYDDNTDKARDRILETLARQKEIDPEVLFEHVKRYTSFEPDIFKGGPHPVLFGKFLEHISKPGTLKDEAYRRDHGLRSIPMTREEKLARDIIPNMYYHGKGADSMSRYSTHRGITSEKAAELADRMTRALLSRDDLGAETLGHLRQLYDVNQFFGQHPVHGPRIRQIVAIQRKREEEEKKKRNV